MHDNPTLADLNPEALTHSKEFAYDTYEFYICINSDYTAYFADVYEDGTHLGRVEGITETWVVDDPSIEVAERLLARV